MSTFKYTQKTSWEVIQCDLRQKLFYIAFDSNSVFREGMITMIILYEWKDNPKWEMLRLKWDMLRKFWCMHEADTYINQTSFDQYYWQYWHFKSVYGLSPDIFGFLQVI